MAVSGRPARSALITTSRSKHTESYVIAVQDGQTTAQRNRKEFASHGTSLSKGRNVVLRFFFVFLPKQDTREILSTTVIPDIQLGGC